MKFKKLTTKIDLNELRKCQLNLTKIYKPDLYYYSYKYETTIDNILNIRSHILNANQFNLILLIINNNDQDIFNKDISLLTYERPYQLEHIEKIDEDIYYCNIFLDEINYIENKLNPDQIEIIKRTDMKIDKENTSKVIPW
ncbi:hypothetical protein KHQ81_10835 [Mycoplasmatota bacterium]|nr:hypothetical protein KHQ81_10835 [Mycoplasmatota bacterium]